MAENAKLATRITDLEKLVNDMRGNMQMQPPGLREGICVNPPPVSDLLSGVDTDALTIPDSIVDGGDFFSWAVEEPSVGADKSEVDDEAAEAAATLEL